MARKRNVEVRDLMRIRMVSDPQISPDGRRVAFVHTSIDYKKDEYVSDLWLADLETGRVDQFTSGRGKDKNPGWSPDGRSLLFTSKPPTKEEEKKKPQLYVIPVDGGEARLLTDMEGGVEAPRWSPDGRRILFISAFREEEPEGDVKVVKRILYRYNPVGYFDGRRKHLFTVRARGGKPRQITEEEFDVDSAEWLEKGRAVAFVSNLDADADLTWAKYIYAVDARGGEPRRLTDGPRTVTSFKPSPLGDAIAYIGHDFRRGLATNQDIWVVPVEGGESRNLTRAFDQDIGMKPSCDVRVASPNPNPQWSADAEAIYFTSTYGGVVRLYRVPSGGGEVEPVLGAVDHSVEAWSMSGNGVIAYTTLETAAPIELWVKGGGEPRRITDFNRRWKKGLNLCGHERFEFRSSAGHTVEGWLMHPPDFREGEQYPMVLEIHGGPRSVYGHSLMHEFQVLAAQGWVVVYVNPYGSGGYEEDFQAGLPGHYGEQDYADLMQAVDYVLDSYGFIDPTRLGVTGGSYGGYMTNWIVSHTDRFRAAVTQRSISNWMSLFGSSDIGWTFGRWDMDGIPWADEEKYMAKSPIRYVENVKTPTLIIHSEEDYRCPIEQAEQFFTALKFLGVPTELVRFPGENHDLSRSGKPKHREQRLNHIIRWFKTYL
jgi:dipeptidyl aminopeptidase/acylaminoacyl peptidase